MPPPEARKSSHKAAEQKRRDSLKTTYDELRVLLPRIPLPGEDGGGSGGSGSNVGGGTSAENSIFGNVVNPLLPGALPPRGPPKPGGEGPNKSVSKLQRLICGNEYIKTLKGRVERRDDEIVRLRREVKKLRQLLGLVGNQGGEGIESGGESGGSSIMGDEQGEPYAMSVASLLEHLDLELDLDKDIDAVETGSGTMETAGGVTTASSHLAIEDDDEEDY